MPAKNTNKQSNLLIVDDNKSILTALKLLLKPYFNNIIATSTPNRINEIFSKERIDVVLLDMNFKAGLNTGNEGKFWLNEILKLSPETSVIMMTAYGDIQLAIDTLKNGATDFVVKPWDNDKLISILKSASNSHSSEKQETSKNKTGIIGESVAIKNVIKTIEKVAQTDANILITGENGTGKEVVAHELHKLSQRSKKAMVTVDMGAVSETLFESELFGHCKGAFTDAKADRAGKFETADNSSLFLDEIGNLSLSLQAKLLVALQSREISRLGSDKPIPINIRLICATNLDLEESVNKGNFREDLLYRVNTIHIEIPPLREREKDVLLLADFFLEEYSNKYGKSNITFSDEAKKKLLAYSWPGNVRELQHTVEKAIILADSNCLQPSDLYLKSIKQPTSTINEAQTIDEMERSMIETAIERHSGNMSAVAQQLGITRQTLYNKVKKYKL